MSLPFGIIFISCVPTDNKKGGCSAGYDGYFGYNGYFGYMNGCYDACAKPNVKIELKMEELFRRYGRVRGRSSNLDA